MSIKKVITVSTDESCKMAKVDVDGEVVMEGNYWDFHPGCHGINEYGDFSTATQLAVAISVPILKKGEDVTIEFIKYKYPTP